jgi:hypothetical protein
MGRSGHDALALPLLIGARIRQTRLHYLAPVRSLPNVRAFTPRGPARWLAGKINRLTII